MFGNPGFTEPGFLDRWPNDFRYVPGLPVLWSAAHHSLPLTVIVVNSAGNGAMRSFSQELAETEPRAPEAALHAGLITPRPMPIKVTVDAAVPTLYQKP
ncbi:hypothetical protein GCM10011504_45360 [Siccirubricoccus deserti]|uniref:Uncharacterized protein n=1 Tax=Siccirubricoccus deserti TaxID=2013562 RepID=A0A9X0UER4_9PROT|nr:hypothetical protein [Siccirubricoccus deserti]MBC4017937.1 hypothetical protein [Siccirubricoccus deserti]GGC62029.1 hypothetical protein GCM10011504_45360 [Siccirubricoccus deserti]